MNVKAGEKITIKSRIFRNLKKKKTGEASTVFKTQKTSLRWKGPPFQTRRALTVFSKWSTKGVPETVSQSTLKWAFTGLLSYNLYGLGHKGPGGGEGWRGWRLIGEKLRFLRPIYNLQLALYNYRFCIHGFNQPWIENVWKKISRMFQEENLDLPCDLSCTTLTL